MHFPRPTRINRGVPIIPMIDILLVVLIFFVVTTNFKKPRAVIRIELPTVREVPSEQVKDERSVLAVDKQGNVTLDKLRVPDTKMLDGYLKAFLKQNPNRKLELEADRELPLEKLLNIWDALTRAGIPVKDVPARIRLPQEAQPMTR
jgi:biopolymer transport protein ExbD